MRNTPVHNTWLDWHMSVERRSMLLPIPKNLKFLTGEWSYLLQYLVFPLFCCLYVLQNYCLSKSLLLITFIIFLGLPCDSCSFSCSSLQNVGTCHFKCLWRWSDYLSRHSVHDSYGCNDKLVLDSSVQLDVHLPSGMAYRARATQNTDGVRRFIDIENLFTPIRKLLCLHILYSIFQRKVHWVSRQLQ